MIPRDGRPSNGRNPLPAIALAFLAAITAAAVPAWASDRHWNAANGSWGISANWNPNGVPGTSDIVYVDYFSGGPGVCTVTLQQASPVSVHVLNSNILQIGGGGVNAGSLGVGGDFIVGFQGTHGTMNVTSSDPGIVFYPGRLSVGNTMRIGMYSGVGTFNQNDGTVTVSQLLRVADSNGAEFPAFGTYNLSGYGVLDAARLDVGYGGDTNPYSFMQGTFNLGGNAVLNVATGAQAHDLQIGGGGSYGVFNQTGGTLNSPYRLIDMARGGGTAVYNYSGGTVAIPGIAFSNNNGTCNYLAGANLPLGQLQLTGGGHVLLSSGHNKTLRTTLLWVANNSAVVDLNDNAMSTASVLESAGGQSLRTLLTRGYNGGAWTGNGVTSTAARLDAQHKTALGYAVASDVLVPSGGIYQFNGQTVSASSSIVKYTYYGDANLDGQVDISDLGRLATNWQTSAVWSQGDFDYSGFVDISDLGKLATNWQAGVGVPLGPSFDEALASVGLGGAIVPEPSSSMALLAATLMLARKPRRDRSSL